MSARGELWPGVSLNLPERKPNDGDGVCGRRRVAAGGDAPVTAPGWPVVFSQAFAACHAFQRRVELEEDLSVFVYACGIVRICRNHSN